jgi:hypothetical protein
LVACNSVYAITQSFETSKNVATTDYDADLNTVVYYTLDLTGIAFQNIRIESERSASERFSAEFK